MRKFILHIFSVFLLVLPLSLAAQNGCPGCAVILPDSLAEDTIYLSDALPGRVGEYYSADMSFRMPKTTSPVAANDPDVIAGLAIQKMTISNVSNLPPGLLWEANQTAFDPDEETDGCVKFCGTPLQPGLYNVDVVVIAEVLFVQQVSSFSFPMLIEPSISLSDGFSMVNNSGCGSVEVSFENHILSDGAEGFSYSWDFGNGASSIDEHPQNQFYTEPGEYTVSYQAIVDTAQYYLTSVDILSASCNDFLGGKPDIYVEILDPNDSLIYFTPQFENTNPPIFYNMTIPIGPGDYTLRVIDDDGGIDGGDDICGVVNFNQLSNGNINDSEMTLSIEIVHPVDTITSSGTVNVYEQPAPPVITHDEYEALCTGDEIRLFSSYPENIQWYHDSIPFLEEMNLSDVVVNESGNYWVIYTSPDGCIATSQVLELSFGVPPQGIAYTAEHNLLTVYDPESLPEPYSIQWLLNDEVIEGEIDLNYCLAESGNYTLMVTDLSSSCAASFSQNIEYDVNWPNCISGIKELNSFEKIKLYPNPGNGFFQIEFELDKTSDIFVRIFDSTGKLIQKQFLFESSGTEQMQFDLTSHASGLYFVELRGEGIFGVLKYLKQ